MCGLSFDLRFYLTCHFLRRSSLNPPPPSSPFFDSDLFISSEITILSTCLVALLLPWQPRPCENANPLTKDIRLVRLRIPQTQDHGGRIYAMLKGRLSAA